MDEREINSELLKRITDHYLNSTDFNGFVFNYDNKNQAILFFNHS